MFINTVRILYLRLTLKMQDLDPRDTYADASVWEGKAQDLASRFVKNFVKYTGNDAGKALVKAGPQVK